MTEPSRLRSIFLFASLLFLLLTVGHFCGDGDFNVFYTANRQLFLRLNPYNFHLYSKENPFGLPNSPLNFLIAAPTCFFPLPIAVPAWDIICLLFWAASTYLWIGMIWKKPLSFEDFAKAGVAGAIAPLYWAFGAHQMVFQVLFFATVACWITYRKGSAFWAGAATGAMLMKPHLVAVLALALFLKSRRKLLFSAGAGLALALPFTLFMHTLRPPSDLRDWALTLHQFGSQVYYADEQGLVSRAVSVARRTLGGHDIRHTGAAPGVIIPEPTGQTVFRIKIIFWILGVGLWALWWRRNGTMPDGELFALTLSWSVLVSVYSHLYDGILLIPVVLLALREASKIWTFSNLFGVFFAINSCAAWISMSNAYFRGVKWQMEGWASAFYFAMSLMTLLYARRHAPQKSQ